LDVWLFDVCCMLRAPLLFKYQATFPSLTCSFPTWNINIKHSHIHTQKATPSSSDQEPYSSYHSISSFHLLEMASKSYTADSGGTPATPKAGGRGGGGGGGVFESLTAREQEILAKAMTCLKTAPEVSICIEIQVFRPWLSVASVSLLTTMVSTILALLLQLRQPTCR
jgi:hypothetical protein